jgi:hypothetical protein
MVQKIMDLTNFDYYISTFSVVKKGSSAMKSLFCFWVARFKLLVSFQVMKNITQPLAQIKIPEPCQEDWTGMVLKDDGRFCKNCSKSVIDFSRFTDQQLHEYFETHRNSSICGRIPVSKLNTPFEIP